MHLWEVKHSYYFNEGNYYSNNCHHEYKKWTDFFDGWGDSDLDMNYVARWDWIEYEEPVDDYYRGGCFKVQIVGQRKARLQSIEVAVCRADEPAVIEFLQPRFEYAMKLWQPLNA